MAVLSTALLSSNLLLSRTAFSQALIEHAFRDRTGVCLELFRSGLEACGVRDEGLSASVDAYQKILDGRTSAARCEPLFRIIDWIKAHPVESEKALFRMPRGLFSTNTGTSFFHFNFPTPEGVGGEAVLGVGTIPGRSRPSKTPGWLASPDSSGSDDEDKPKAALVSFQGIYRDIVPAGEIGREIAAFRDKRKDFDDRLEALSAAGRILTVLDADSDDFFKGVVALFELASRPRAKGPLEFRDQLRLEAVRLLDAALQRVPTDPRRQEIFVHAYLRFKEAAQGDLIRSSFGTYGTPARALAATTEQIGYKLAGCRKHCSKAVQRVADETGWELVQSGMWGGNNLSDAPWTLEKAKRNGKIGLALGGAMFASYAILAGIALIFSASVASWILAFGAVLFTGTTLTGLLWRAPRRLRHKIVSRTLSSGRKYVRELEGRNRPALPRAERRKLPPK